MILYGVTVFVSAFLLFLVQPLVGKYILPWFGGTPTVWTTCLLFFQVLLLAGYAYAHLLASRLSIRKQALVSLLLLALTITLLPIAPSERWKPTDVSAPTWQILGLLSASIGACYFLLSSTSPLLQAWFIRTRPNSSPYRLYSFSSLGSLIAVASYPFLIEPTFGLDVQASLWSYSYIIFATLCAVSALLLFRNRSINKTDFSPGAIKESENPGYTIPTPADRILWLCLTALSSTLLLATTNQMCLDVAAIPLLWLLPIGLYLLSFILCFHSEIWYSRLLFGIVLTAALVQMCAVLYQGIVVKLPIQIASYSFTLFACCMVCHGELIRIKPGPRYLTSFYLTIAAGGALGAVFVSLAAPRLFKGYWEFHLGLAATALLFLIILFRDPKGRLHRGKPPWAWAILCTSFIVLVLVLGNMIRETLENNILVRRNFFGVLKVLEEERGNPDDHRIVLMHGRIEHGYQFVAGDKRHWTTSYYGYNSGVGIAIRSHPQRLKNNMRKLRIGVVGLGTGTLATYGEEGDYFRFYEVNPEVIRISETYFTYRKDSKARVDVVLGDARISLEREKSLHQTQQFDVLAIDAFSSDAIPVHLLTRECYQIFWYHLKRDGILAMHVSNRYFNLSPVVRSLAELDPEQQMQAILVEDAGSALEKTDATDWILVTRNREFLTNHRVQQAVRPWSSEDPPPLLFTDDYSNLISLLR